MIDFRLDGLHPSYERDVRDVISGLAADYPLVGDLRVELYRREGDGSLGCAPERGLIRLNSRWFGRPIEELRAAAETDDLVWASGVALEWHGGMVEPGHVLTHEFGHQLQFMTPGWAEFTEPHWRQSCLDPAHCRPPSGYALGSPDEFWADAFAAMRLGYESEVARLLREFLQAGNGS